MTLPNRMFEVPRIAVAIDEADPDILKLTFGGTVELDRTNQAQVDLFNGLRAGEIHDLVVSTYVTGARKIHRRDSEGDVDAVIDAKALSVSDVFPMRAEGAGA